MPRHKLDKTRILARVERNTPNRIKNIAEALGYIYDTEGSTGQLLDAIANGEILLVSTKKENK